MKDLNTFELLFVTKSPEETFKFAKNLGEKLGPGDVVALIGDLGSGKTHFVKGLAKGLKVNQPEEVRSPTFSLIQEYDGKIPLCHADLYRLSPTETLHLGLEEYWLGKKWAVAVEWADKSKKLIPEHALRIEFEMLSPNERRLKISGAKPWKKKIKK